MGADAGRILRMSPSSSSSNAIASVIWNGPALQWPMTTRELPSPISSRHCSPVSVP